MAIVRHTMAQIQRTERQSDRAKINISEREIRRHMIEDGQDPEERISGFAPVIPAQILWKHLGMTQPEFAKALRIPLKTLRNWEQGRVLPDPAARSLLTIVAKNSRLALKALAVDETR